YTQTLEPQVQYLFVPEEDQNDIGYYDTTLLQTDYYGLFRSRKYSGVDRIAAANQLSYGASSRFYDDAYKERLNVSFGQIFFIDKDTKSPDANNTEESKSNYSSWAVEVDFNYDDYFFYHGGVQYDIDSGSMQLANSTFEYKLDKGFVQTNYRYVTKEYIDDNVGESIPDINSITREGISQAGIVSGYQFTQNWYASAQYYHDMNEDIAIEWLANLRYTSDCWYVGMTYSNELRNWSGDTGYANPDSNPEYENNFSINFGIVGFGTNIGSGSTEKGYDSSGNSLEYGRPFFLNN
ncbi:LPS assembly protein LptD, partial [Vibrio gallaecicus]